MRPHASRGDIAKCPHFLGRDRWGLPAFSIRRYPCGTARGPRQARFWLVGVEAHPAVCLRFSDHGDLITAIQGVSPLPGVIPINKGLSSKHPKGYPKSIPNESRFFALITICWDE